MVGLINYFNIQEIGVISELLTIIIAVFGALVAILKVMETMWTTAMSSPIEVALMTKREQYKYKTANMVLVLMVFSITFIATGFVKVQVDISQSANVKINEITQASVNETEHFEVGKNDETEKNPKIENESVKSEKADNVGAVIFIFSCVVTMVILAYLLVAHVIEGIMAIGKWIKSMTPERLKIYKIGAIVIVGNIVVLAIMCRFMPLGKWLMSLIWLVIIEGGIALIYYARKQKSIERIIEKLTLLMYVFVVLLMYVISTFFVWNVHNIDNVEVGMYIKMIIESIMLVLIICLYMLLAMKLSINPGQARIMYYNKEKEKDLYIYFKYNDELLIAGEEEKVEDCDEYYLVKMEDVIGERLARVTDEAGNYARVYAENIVLELDGESDIVIKDVIDKLTEKLREKDVTRKEYSETGIYIQHKNRMVYFYLPNEKIARPDQNFRL